MESYRGLIDQVALDVKTSARDVETQWYQISSNRRSVFAAADALEALEARREVEDLTPSFIQLVLDQQERLAESQRAEAEAIANYNIAIAKLEQSKGTLLRYNNIVMEEERIPYIKTLMK